MPKLQILLVYPYLPHPAVTHGSGRLLLPLLMRWREHVDITLVCGHRAPERAHVEATRAIVHRLHVADMPLKSDMSTTGRLLETGRTALREATTGHPRFVVKHDRSAIRGAIRDARVTTDFDVAQVEIGAAAVYGDELKGLPSVLVDHEAGAASGDDLQHDPKTRRFVRQTYPLFTEILALCREDATDIEAVLGHRAVGVRHPGVEIPALIPASTADAGAGALRAGQPGRGLFFGSAAHTPNLDALVWLGEDIWPRVQAAMPDAVLAVAGGPFPAQVERALDRVRAERLGTLPNLGAELDRASVVVAPVRLGHGVRIKNLETLARGRPLVTTKLGARGLGLVSGVHAQLADAADAFAAAVVEVLREPAGAAAMARAGRTHVENSFTHEAAAAANLEVWRRLASTAPRGG